MNTAEQLHEFYDFSPAVVDRVSETMDRVRSYETYQDFFKSVGFTGIQRWQADGYKPSAVISLAPKDYDETEAICVSLAMGQPLDMNNIYQVALVAAHFPNMQVNAFSNPSGVGYKGGRVSFGEMGNVARGDFTATVDAELKYHDAKRLERVYRGGYSYGVDKALAATIRANQDTPALALIEPASVISRNLKELGDAFKSAEPALADYVQATDLPTFLDARERSIWGKNYLLALARPTNIAVAKGIGRGLFGTRAAQALLAQPDMQMTVAWGSESELASDTDLQLNMDILKAVHGNHARAMRMIGRHHALGDMLPVKLAILDEAFTVAA